MVKGKKDGDDKGAGVLSRLSLYTIIGKLAIIGIIFIAFLTIIYTIFAAPLANMVWLFDIDPTSILIGMALVAFFFTVMLWNMTMRGKRGSKSG